MHLLYHRFCAKKATQISIYKFSSNGIIDEGEMEIKWNYEIENAKEDNTTYNKVTENTSENKDETPKDNKIIFFVLPVLVIVSIGLIFVFLIIKHVK